MTYFFLSFIYLKYLLTADFANIFHDDLLLTLAISCIVLYFLIVHIYLYPDSIQEALAHTNTALEPVCCKKWQKIVPLLVWRIRAI